MTTPEHPDISQALARLAAEGAEAPQLAAAFGASWRQIEVALAPIIGKQGVAALLQRSLHLSARAHPWLAGQQATGRAPADVDSLTSTLGGRSADEAAAAGAALLQTFYDLVSGLIGAPLARRLLHSLWQPS